MKLVLGMLLSCVVLLGATCTPTPKGGTSVALEHVRSSQKAGTFGLAAAAGVTNTPENGEYWRVTGISVQVAPSATAGNRSVTVQILPTGSGNVPRFVTWNANIPASTFATLDTDPTLAFNATPKALTMFAVTPFEPFTVAPGASFLPADWAQIDVAADQYYLSITYDVYQSSAEATLNVRVVSPVQVT